MEVEEASDGKGVMKIVKEKNFDIIFMDIQLPHENGLNLTKKIKSIYPGITIIIITEYDSSEYRKAASQADADFFFSKTDLKTNEIINVIESILYDSSQ
jgi:DNA-binding NarL/FixJ family response regulator